MVLGLSWPPVSYYVNLKLVFSKDLVHFIEIIRSICEELSVFLLSPVWGFLPMVPDTLFSYRSHSRQHFQARSECPACGRSQHNYEAFLSCLKTVTPQGSDFRTRG